MFLIEALFTSIFIILFIAIALITIFLLLKNRNSENYTLLTSNQKEATKILVHFNNISYDKIEKISNSPTSIFTIKNKLKAIANDDKIKQVIFDLTDANISFTNVYELEDVLKDLKAKKEVISIADIYNKGSYLLASFGSKIYLEKSATSSLFLNGYNIKIPYYKKLLEKIGVTVKVLHIGDYKSAGENYVLEEMSDNLKETLQNLNDSNLNYFIEKIKENRGVDISQDLLNAKLMLNSSDKLIDKRIDKYLLLDEDEELMDISNYNIKEKKKDKNKDLIAVITLDGVISDNDVNFNEAYKKLNKALIEDNLKGIVLQINSPGGSAYISSQIYRLFKNECSGIPIFVSMKDVTASGGYYISSVARKIYATPTTITGSIGVVSMYYSFNKLLDMIGIKYDGIEKGKAVEYTHFNQELSEDTENIILNSSKQVYREFKNVVMRSRIMTDKRLEKIAQGKVFTAKEALENGLIDGIANLDETIKNLAKYLKLEDYKVKYISKKIDIKEEIKANIPISINFDTSLMNKALMLYVN